MMQSQGTRIFPESSRRMPYWPLVSSSQTKARSAGRSLPDSIRVLQAQRMDAHPPFISVAPLPKTVPPAILPENGSSSQPSERAGTTSTWPQKRSLPFTGFETRLSRPPGPRITVVGMPSESVNPRMNSITSRVSPGGFSLLMEIKSEQSRATFIEEWIRPSS
jgi:hypothetical protein